MTTENQQPRARYRINVNRLAKGQVSWDCTVELDGPIELLGPDHDSPSRVALCNLQAAALAESDQLVGELQRRYPMAVE